MLVIRVGDSLGVRVGLLLIATREKKLGEVDIFISLVSAWRRRWTAEDPIQLLVGRVMVPDSLHNKLTVTHKFGFSRREKEVKGQMNTADTIRVIGQPGFMASKSEKKLR